MDRTGPRSCDEPGLTRATGLALGAALLAAVATGPLGAQEPTDSGAPPEPPRRVLLVTIDTLRADHLGVYGHPRPTSPFLDSLAAEGAWFPRAYASSAHTAPSHASLFTSLPPRAHGLLENGQPLSAELPTIASLFRDAGYETAAFLAVRFLGQLGTGFETVDARTPRGGRQGPRFRPVDRTLAAARKWLAERGPDDRFFLWIHLYDVHEHLHDAPLEQIRQVRAEGTRELAAALDARQDLHRSGFATRVERQVAIDRYDACIRLVDAELEQLHAFLESRDLDDGTLWIVTSDHGEGLGDHGYLYHGKLLYEEQIHVPLILNDGSERFARGGIATLARHVDLLPTLADLLGVEPPAAARATWIGRSLLPLLRGEALEDRGELAFAQRLGFHTKGWEPGEVFAVQDLATKLIHHAEREDELFDLASDPFETRNLIDDPAHREDAELLRAWLDSALAETPARGADEEPEIDPGLLEELKALGYF